MRYSKYRREPDEKKKGTNPIWRGIGCILFILTPIISIAIANLFLGMGILQRYILIPFTLRNTYTIPVFGFTIRNFYATLILGIAITVLLYAVFFVVYSALYRLIGPPQYLSPDVPPVRVNRKFKKSR